MFYSYGSDGCMLIIYYTLNREFETLQMMVHILLSVQAYKEAYNRNREIDITYLRRQTQKKMAAKGDTSTTIVNF